MKNFENLGKSLSKTQQKVISGGNPPEEGSAEGCSVECSAGYTACCWRNILVAYCKCYTTGGTPPHSCDSGGTGATKCSVDHM